MSERRKRKVIALSKSEEDKLVIKTREINKMLIKIDERPITESELVHIILNESVDYVHLENRKVKIR